MPPRKKTRASTVDRSASWLDDLEGLTERAPKLDRSESMVRAESITDEQLVEVTDLPALRRLVLAVFEGPSQLPTTQQAITGAGHAVAKAASGRAGLEEIRALLVHGSIDAMVVGLPGGEALVDAALALAPRRPVVIASMAGDAPEAIRQAAATGADLVALRPHTIERLAPILLAATRLADERSTATAARGTEASLRARLDALASNETNTIQPFELFQKVLELELRRARRYAYPLSVGLFAVEVPPNSPPGLRGQLRARAGTALIHSIRDIDLATELDHDRFLVLLPYTELTGATEVARRILNAVAVADPVTAGGRRYATRMTGAVSGARPGQPLSFARLMKDATRALEQARADGADLAVSP